MKRGQAALLSSAAVATALAASIALAQETTTFSYDALGRLIASGRTGGPNTGVVMATCFDAAGNRLQQQISVSGSATCATAPSPTSTPTPTPTPTPSPTNHPPVTAADSASVTVCGEIYIDPLTNDSDPDGDTITLTAVSSGGPHGSAALVGDGVNVDYLAGSSAGTDLLSYTIQDSHGATASGTINVTVTGKVCDNARAKVAK